MNRGSCCPPTANADCYRLEWRRVRWRAYQIGRSILFLRAHRLLLDKHLAALYGVQTRVLIQAVKRNLARFPEDFMFQLSAAEWAALRSQTVISKVEAPTHWIHR